MIHCTHIALQVRSIAAAAAFYERYAQLKVIHQRKDGDSAVAWLGWGEDPPQFVIVLIERPYPVNDQPAMNHIGLAVDSRAEVDRIFALARADGLAELWPPTDAGPIVGYFCGLLDPDGNRVEFSYGQRIGPSATA